MEKYFILVFLIPVVVAGVMVHFNFRNWRYWAGLGVAVLYGFVVVWGLWLPPEPAFWTVMGFALLGLIGPFLWRSFGCFLSGPAVAKFILQTVAGGAVVLAVVAHPPLLSYVFAIAAPLWIVKTFFLPKKKKKS